jgi:hypothetical protein
VKLEACYTKAYKAQEKEIRNVLGRKVAEEANYGWFVDGSASVLVICTKCYVDPRAVLVTRINRRTGKLTHTWED